MEIDYLDGIKADVNGTMYPVTSSEVIKFNTTSTGESKFILQIADSESRVRPFLIEPKWKDDYGCQFEIKISDYLAEPDLLSLDIRENNTRSLCKSTFVYIPDLNPVFDKEFYLEEQHGKLSLGDYGRIDFTTDCEEVHQPIKLKGLDADLTITIPSIWIKFDNDQWIGPGEHNYSILDFYWDRISVKSNLKKTIRLYTNVPKIELNPEIMSDSTSFDLFEMRKEIEKLVETSQRSYKISISIGGKAKRDLVNIIVHNIYKFDKDSGVIRCVAQAKLQAEYVLKRNNVELLRKPLTPESNTIHLDNVQGVTLTIYEENPYTNKHSIEMLSAILGNDTYIYQDGEDLIFVYNNKKMRFSASYDFDSLLMDYDSKKRFQAWMNQSEAKSAFKREYGKWKQH